NRLFQPLQNWSHGQSITRALRGFIPDVAGFKIWENKDIRVPRNLRIRHLLRCYPEVTRSIKLQRSINLELRVNRLSASNCRYRALDVRPSTGAAGGIRQHRHSWVNAKLLCRAR